MTNKKKFFIIIGRGRSGTSLLSKILNSNSSIYISGELFFIINLFDKYYKKEINKQVICNFADDVFFEKRLQRENLNKKRLKEYLVKKSPKTYTDLCLLTYENFSIQKSKSNDKLLGGKNPHYALFIPKILEIFENVKFIYIVRDYRDNILSYRNVNFDMNNIYALAQRWNIFNKNILKYKRKYPRKFLLLKYENLILNPDYEIKKLCKFLNIEFEPNMLEFYKNKTIEHSSWHKNLNSKLNTENINKWEKVLSQNEQQKIDYICNSVASQLGYTEKSKFSIILFIKTLVYVIYANLYTYSELALFYMPFSFRTKIINLVRKFQRTN